MLKSAIYSNVFILLIMSIFFLTRIFMKNIDLKKLPFKEIKKTHNYIYNI